MYASFINPQLGGLSLTASDERKATGILSAPLERVSKFAGMLSVVPMIGEVSSLISAATGSAASLLQWFGFSKSNVLDKNYPALITVVDNMSQFNNRLGAYKLGTDCRNEVSISDSMCPLLSKDDQLFSNLCARQGLVDQLNITTAAATGAILAQYPINPTYCFDPDSPVVVRGVEPTPLAFSALPFTYWRGDIDITFEFVASVFHRATVLICFTTNNTAGPPAPTLVTALGGVMTKVVAISGNTTVTYTIPWRQLESYLKVGVWNTNTYPNGLAENNGWVSLLLVNPVTTNGSTDPIAVNVYYSAKNMKFAIPSLLKMNAGPITSTINVLLTSSSLISDVTKSSFGESNEQNDFFDRFFGEDVATSTKKLAMKQAQYVTMSEDPGDGSLLREASFSLSNTLFYQNTFGGQPASAVWSYVTYLMMGYVGVRGSISWTFQPRDPTNVNYMAASTDLTADNTFSTAVTSNPTNLGGYTYGYPKVHPFLHVTAPHYYEGYFRPTCPPVDTLSGSSGDSVRCMLSLPATPITSVRVQNALGDDGQFVFFRGFPLSLF